VLASTALIEQRPDVARNMQEELLRIWLAAQTTIIFVTHSIRESVYLATSVAVMTRRPGRIKEIVPIGLPVMP
jgi:NitT/TauT family transport system ATP-binding protein